MDVFFHSNVDKYTLNRPIQLNNSKEKLASVFNASFSYGGGWEIRTPAPGLPRLTI